MKEKLWNFLFIGWLCATIATLGSLFFSEIMEFVPCQLCWYQRIAMYPLSIILMMGLLRPSHEVVRIALPFSIIGFAIASYHNLLHWKIIPESLAPCQEGISCSTIYIEWFGSVSYTHLTLPTILRV